VEVRSGFYLNLRLRAYPRSATDGLLCRAGSEQSRGAVRADLLDFELGHDGRYLGDGRASGELPVRNGDRSPPVLSPYPGPGSPARALIT